MIGAIVMLTLLRSSHQFLQDASGAFRDPNEIQFSTENKPILPQGRSTIFTQGRSSTTENEIFHGPAVNQNPLVSPYWADIHGRPPSIPPQVNYDNFAPQENTNCSPPRIACNISHPYRTMNGHCNNLVNQQYGMAGQPMPRILPPVYDEGLMRTHSVTGSLLPNPRKVSLGVRNVPPKKQLDHNMMIMQIGQFIDHDYAVVHEIQGSGNTKKQCQDCSSWRDPACAPIPVPSEDTFIPPRRYVTGQPVCLPFVRSIAVGGNDIFGKPSLDQINANSAFLDLSTVYGSDNCREKTLRSFHSGQLIGIKQPENFLKGFPPLVDGDEFEDCRSSERKCFRTGDDRNNEHVGILAIHMLYLREHNRLALQLKKINPHWDDERLFQESRRFNIAQYQHMIYNEFLPALIGIQKMTDYRLHPEKTGYYLGYNERVNPGVLNEFSTSAFRVGHTMVPAHLHFLDKNFFPQATVSLLEIFHNISIALVPGTCDSILRGFVGTRLNAIDLALEEVILDKLFQKKDVLHSGQDLFARNIARSRDHGIAPYARYKAACGGGTDETFDDLGRVMSQSAISALRNIYSSVEDIDLYVGGLAEDPVPGGIVGPTFACIIAYQFLNSRRGDRFWYENAAAGFTTAQLHSIRGAASLSRLLCDNMDHDTKESCSKTTRDYRIPPRSFYIPSHVENPLLECGRIPSVDLSLWTETNLRDPSACTYLGLTYQWNKIVHVSSCLTCICQPDGMLKCEPYLSGCHLQNRDEFCVSICDESQLLNIGRVWSG